MNKDELENRLSQLEARFDLLEQQLNQLAEIDLKIDALIGQLEDVPKKKKPGKVVYPPKRGAHHVDVNE